MAAGSSLRLFNLDGRCLIRGAVLVGISVQWFSHPSLSPLSKIFPIIMADRRAQGGKREFYKSRSRKDSEVNAVEYDTVVLRNLDPSTEIGDIKHGLEQFGFRVLAIRNAYSHVTGLTLPLFFIKLYKNPFNATIFQLKYVAHQVVIVEEYLQGPDLPRCTRCQDLDHTKDSCTNSPVCAWCSGSHYTTMCKEVKTSVPTCARCGGCHPSSYKGCKVYRQKCLMKALEESNKKNRAINSLNSFSELSTSCAKIKEEEVPVTSASSTITSTSSTTTSASSTTTSASTTTTSVSCSITSPSSSIASPSSSISSDVSSFTSYSSSTDARLPGSENVRSEKASRPPGFSLSAPPILEENAFKERLRIVADVTDHFSSMNVDLYLKM